jgi:hypothetical protein
LLLGNAIAHEEGNYDYEMRGMRDIDPDLHAELERDNEERWTRMGQQPQEAQEDDELVSDMDIVSDSDDD